MLNKIGVEDRSLRTLLSHPKALKLLFSFLGKTQIWRCLQHNDSPSGRPRQEKEEITSRDVQELAQKTFNPLSTTPLHSSLSAMHFEPRDRGCGFELANSECKVDLLILLRWLIESF